MYHFGCSKNLIDTEMCIGLFKKAKFEVVNNPEDAEILLINTCGFIESAKEEAINCILEMAEYKNYNCKYLFVMGCLVKRYKTELEKAIPEVDRFISIDEYDKMWEIISSVISYKENDSSLTLDYLDRIVSTGNKTTYLKIAEGCSNRCTYCAIPSIRGPFVSRKKEDILEEAKKLAKAGYEEIIVIAQDTTKYGIDLYGKECLAEILHEVSKIDGIKWIRFLYSYPESITDELIKEVKENDKICKYFDIPLQHFSSQVLKRMNRKSNSESIRKTIQKIRKEIPEAIIRTTVIVGFPGETQENFDELYEFIKEARFEKLGAFKYSKEEGTPAARLPEQIHHRTKQSRYNKIMEIQQKIAKEKLQEKVGNVYEIIIDGMTDDGKFLIGRSYMDIPDEDGVIYIENKKDKNLTGKFVKCKITGVRNYDLVGTIE